MSVAILRRRVRAFTLVELIVLIVIMGIAAYALLNMFRQTLPRSPSPSQLTQAAHCAQERMELILGRRVALGTLGFGNLALDPSGAATCPADAALTVNVTGASALAAWSVDGSTSRYRLITVTVAAAGTQLAELNALLADY
jgi:type II secretory pathway pseudopilin PulG